MKTSRFFPALVLLFGACVVQAADAPNLLRNNNFNSGLESWFLKGADRCKSEVAATAQEKFQRALHLQVQPQAKDVPWSVVLRQTIGAPLQKGQQLTLKIWLRSPEQAQVTAFVENAAPPYNKLLTQTFALTNDWHEYEIKAECPENITPGGANCGFFLSHGKGNIYLADVRLFQTDKETPPAKIEAPKTEAPRATSPKPSRIVEPLLEDEDFEHQLEGWTLPEEGTLKAEIVAATLGELPQEWTKVLKISSALPFEPAFYPQRTLTQRIVLSVAPQDGVQLKFWARSPQNCKLYVSARSTKTNALLLNEALNITPKWKEFDLRKIMRNAINDAAGRLSFMVGAVNGPLEIAGLHMERLTNVPDKWDDPPPVFNYENLLDNGDFTDNQPKINTNGPLKVFGRWLVFTNSCEAEIVAAETEIYKSALRLTPVVGAQRAAPIRVDQDLKTPPLGAADILVLRFWARGTNGDRLSCDFMRRYLQRQNTNSFTSKTASSTRQVVALSADWKEYEMPLAAKEPRPDAPEKTTLGGLSLTIYPAFPAPGAIEITGVRLAIQPTAP